MNSHEIALLLRAAAEMVRMQSELVSLASGQMGSEWVDALATEIVLAAEAREMADARRELARTLGGNPAPENQG